MTVTVMAWLRNNPALTNRYLMRLYGAQALSSIGSWLTTVAFGLWILQTTGSAATAALMTALASAPYAVLLLVGGAVSDRFNPKLVLVVTFTAQAATTCLLAWQISAGSAWGAAAAKSLGTLVSSFSGPATAALVRRIATEAERVGAASISTGIGGGTRLIGPAVAAGVLALVPAPAALVVDGATTLLLAAVVASLPAGLAAPAAAGAVAAAARRRGPAQFVSALLAGFAHLWRDAVLRPRFVMWAAALVCVNMTVLYPVITRDVFGEGWVLGAMYSATGAGSLASMVWLLPRPGYAFSRMVVGVALLSAGMAATAAGTTPAPVLAGCALFGAGLSALNSAYNAAVAVRTPVHLAGRTRSATEVVLDGTTVLVGPVAGLLADRVGGAAALEVFAALAAALAAVGLLRVVLVAQLARQARAAV